MRACLVLTDTSTGDGLQSIFPWLKDFHFIADGAVHLGILFYFMA